MNPLFEELMVSENIWLTDSDNVIYPVNLKDSSTIIVILIILNIIILYLYNKNHLIINNYIIIY